MLESVLNGQSYKIVSKEYNIHPVTARTACLSEVIKAGSDLWEEGRNFFTNQRRATPSLAWLRDNKERILKSIDGTDPSIKKCICCEFWEEFLEAEDGNCACGYCRRFPPVLQPQPEDPNNRDSDYLHPPQTESDCWCGEFKRKIKGK